MADGQDGIWHNKRPSEVELLVRCREAFREYARAVGYRTPDAAHYERRMTDVLAMALRYMRTDDEAAEAQRADDLWWDMKAVAAGIASDDRLPKGLRARVKPLLRAFGDQVE